LRHDRYGERPLCGIDKAQKIGFNLNAVKMKSVTKRKRAGRAYHHGDLRRALIEEAARLGSREGVEALSLRRVAAAAGVSPAAPYHHFKNKSDLLAAVADEGFRRLHAAMTRASGAGRAVLTEERLRGMGRAYVRFAVRNPHYFRLMFRPEIARAAEPDPDSWGQRAFFLLIRTIQEMLGEEGEPSDAVMKEVVYAWSVVHGLAALWVDGALSIEDPFASWGIDALADHVTNRAGVGK
jgi:AcrR family transcriptional regulator